MAEETDNRQAEVMKLVDSGYMQSAILLYHKTYKVGFKEAVDSVRKLAGLPPRPEEIDIPLSAGTQHRLARVFKPEKRMEAARLLVKCGNLPWFRETTPESLERIRYAALKLSDGDLSSLQEAINLAYIDWRDLLVAADFANDVDAHKSWFSDLPC